MRNKRINDSEYIGLAFNSLVVEDTEEVNGLGKHRKAICKCVCGKVVRVAFNDLRNGHYKSCGCLKRDRIIKYSTIHGMAKHPLAAIYSAMVQRCTNPNDKNYSNYGGRGITVCQEWIDDNKLFFSWALSNGWKQGLDIDRRDNEKGYCPENCRCVTRLVNNRNKRKKPREENSAMGFTEGSDME